MPLETLAHLSGLSILLVEVSDMDRSLAFWRDGLGIAFVANAYGDGSYNATLGDLSITLHPDFRPHAKDVRGTGLHLHFKVSDADRYYEPIVARGLAPDEKPSSKPWGREFSITDPNGYSLEIIGPNTDPEKIQS